MRLADAHGWQASVLAGGSFELAAWLPRDIVPADELTIYIEGDGLAWLTPDTPSADPTPRAPLALQLALTQPDGNAAYLARPCQYVGSARCEQRYWTNARFAPDVIAASDQAVDALKAHFAARRLILVGYSGGGTVAALLAARRHDVVRLVTVAGNLDVYAWTSLHKITPLAESLDPADFRTELARIPQRHLVGSDDRVVPPPLVTTFAAGMPDARVIVIPGYDHHCCWAEHWPKLWREIP